MLHQISLYMDEQWKICAVTLWPPLKDSQCLSPWLMFSVCSYGCSWAYASVFFFFFFSFFSCLSLRFSAATESLIIFIHIGAFFAIGTGRRNINLVWSLLNLNYIFQNSSYQVISLGGFCGRGGGGCLYQTGPIDAWTGWEFIWLFSSAAYLMPSGSSWQQSMFSEEI